MFQLKTTASAISPAMRGEFLRRVAEHMRKVRGLDSGDGSFARLCWAAAAELRQSPPKTEAEHAPLVAE
jgi:hypothetical protein